eukprot:s117_g11.t1
MISVHFGALAAKPQAALCTLTGCHTLSLKIGHPENTRCALCVVVASPLQPIHRIDLAGSNAADAVSFSVWQEDSDVLIKTLQPLQLVPLYNYEWVDTGGSPPMVLVSYDCPEFTQVGVN